MGSKMWYKTVIAKEEQNIEIYPAEGFDGIILGIQEVSNIDGTSNCRLFLNKNEMELLILKMQEMMDHVLND